MYLPAKLSTPTKNSWVLKDRRLVIQYVQNVKWINAWKEVLDQIIKISFLKFFLSNSEDGTQDNIVWDNSISSDEDA
jgi:hypothetical protein